ncbi:MAG: tRNA (N(6)-L-threonylcarbamoyladenosine(37)-C(2))-methylthiotransferase MtaB [Bacteroidia bacterium]|nr:tRNA (N(6)-L-threonylcarbamoyladenosine(37)-C(2))-methylthiotransferase MtaB [Bacteroidia bacterium]MDW8332696.1 tRNA (N(6)-L-threonylcarbamoyladenosine(37)-C(2))-methylthiotransferase MtaB [Bacteroidia bacterium]
MSRQAPTVAFHTLGCKLNFSETAELARRFRERGYEVVDFDGAASVYVVNTCSVTEEAEKKCRKAVRRALSRNPDAFVAVVGCYAQLRPDEIAQIEGVDAVLGAAEKFRLLELIPRLDKRFQTEVHRCVIAEAVEFVAAESLDERVRAFVKVQDGCDYKCSFCTIPAARGRSRSDDLARVVERVNRLADAGVKEIVLTGVNLGDYGAGTGHDLLDLLKALESRTNVERIRLSSVEPNLLSDEIAAWVAEHPRFMPHFHMPLQSGSDAILARMRRRYRSRLYAERVRTLKRLMPHCAIGCDVIVGFPGETEAHFEQTRRLIEDLDVSYLHVFPFSPRPDTLAADFPDHVPEDVKRRRAAVLRALSDDKYAQFYRQNLGTTRTVLVERVEDDFAEGHTENYLKVRFSPSKSVSRNDLISVTVS